MQHNCSNNAWVLDSGAMDHMVNSISGCLATCTKPTKVWLPNGTAILVTNKGTVSITKKDLCLQDVLCVSYFSVNLLSISKFTKNSTATVSLQAVIV